MQSTPVKFDFWFDGDRLYFFSGTCDKYCGTRCPNTKCIVYRRTVDGILREDGVSAHFIETTGYTTKRGPLLVESERILLTGG